MSLRRTAASLLASTVVAGSLLAGGLTASASAEAAAASGCVTKAEYKLVKDGMTMTKVHKILGTKGKQVTKQDLGDAGVVIGRGYTVCNKRTAAVAIVYVDNVVTEKSAQW